MDIWDKRAYESGLDLQVVSWPTHYVAATQSFGREREDALLETMQREKGWSLSGNFAVMVWLEQNFRMSRPDIATARQAGDILTVSGLNNHLLLNLTGSAQNTVAVE